MQRDDATRARGPAPTAASGNPATGAGGLLRAGSVAELAECVREARDSAAPLRIRGGGTWMHGGRPCTATTTLDLGALSGIVEYVPGDLTLTARAGTTLEEIDLATRAHGQWLPLDPIAAPAATLGATLATGSTGALASSIGRPRDLTLGLEVVTGDGEVIRAGGRVVKNVAGFDLVRLQLGAWGTLGVLTEATVRLRARPANPAQATSMLALDERAVSDLPRSIARLGVDPLAVELLDASWPLAAGSAGTLLLGLSGNASSLEAQRRACAALGESLPVTADVWSVLRTPEPPGSCVLRLSSLPSDFPAVWLRAAGLSSFGALVRRGAPMRGIVRCALSLLPDVSLPALHQALAQVGARVVLETAPAALWPGHPRRGHTRLSTGLQRAFDPAHILNPGVMDVAT